LSIFYFVFRLNGQVPDVALAEMLHPGRRLAAANIAAGSKRNNANHSSLACHKFEKPIFSGILAILRRSFANRYGAVNEMAWRMH
jgi:hypothetical protein